LVGLSERALDHYVAQVDADAKLHPPFGRQTLVLRLKCALNLDRALDGIHHAGELGEDAIACRVYEPSVVLLDETIDGLAVRGQSAKCRLFVLPHEAAVAIDVGAEYRGELAFHPVTLAPTSLEARLAQVVADPFLPRRIPKDTSPWW
jgi:hypothetical protein